MPKVEFRNSDGGSTTLDAPEGFSLMEVAVQNGVDGIDADCGGACTCATCHVYVADEWLEKLSPPQRAEADMLEFAIDPAPNSRLSCQITITPDLDGLTVTIPERQH